MTAPQSELFDTIDAAPLFAGLPVPVPVERTAPPPGGLAQMALCCSTCGGAGPYLRTRTGAAICYTCARELAQGGK
jgi:hypothetical protein